MKSIIGDLAKTKDEYLLLSVLFCSLPENHKFQEETVIRVLELNLREYRELPSGE